jgi:hypothetical protein
LTVGAGGGVWKGGNSVSISGFGRFSLKIASTIMLNPTRNKIPGHQSPVSISTPIPISQIALLKALGRPPKR